MPGYVTRSLLGPSDQDPVAVLDPPGGATGPVVVASDHAGRALPASIAATWHDPSALDRHIAYDIGAEPMARRLAERLGATAVLGTYSRLVADLNRYPHDPAFAPVASDGITVAFNADLSPAERWARLAGLHRPYHDALAGALDAAARRGPAVLVSVHTMTPRLSDGLVRPWHQALLHAADGGALDRGLADRLLVWLGRHGTGPVGDNVPYSLDVGIDFTIPEHAMRRNIPFLMFEVRQDLVSTAEGARSHADLMAEGLMACLPSLSEVRRSHA